MRKLSIVMLGLLLLPAAGLFAAAEAEMAADAPMPITWAGVGGAGVGENTVIEQLLEEKFNVEIDTIRYHQNDREKHNLLVASGEHPDAWYVWNFHDQKFMEGAYRTIPRSMIEEEMPFYVDAMNEIGTAGWAYFLAPGKSDEYWAIPRFQQQFGKEGNGAQHYLRYDWLERVGMTDFFDAVDQSPESKPDTFYWEPAVHDIDEFESVLAAFRDKLDFGDGQVRIPYGFTGDQTQAFMFRASLVLYAYGLNNKPSYDYDGDTVPPYGGELVMDGNCPCFRDATKRLQKWYSEGYIDPELPAVGFEQWKDRIASGVYGICTTCGVTGWGWAQRDGDRPGTGMDGGARRRRQVDGLHRPQPQRHVPHQVQQPGAAVRQPRGRLHRQPQRVGREAAAPAFDLRLRELRPARPDHGRQPRRPGGRALGLGRRARSLQ